LSGPGYATCSATASGAALSLGIIRAKDLVAAVSNGGTLPYALAVDVKCSNGFVPPMTSGYSTSAGCPPLGARAYLALHDSDVNGTGAPGIVKALLRTIDEDHYGMFLVDENGGEDGFTLTAESDVSYTAFGLSGPLNTTVVPLAQSEGLLTAQPFNGVWYVQLPATGLNLANQIKFL
jgi:hypothetical protein